MLGRIGSREITEWKGYERAFGPLGGFYEADILAGIHEQLQRVCLMLADGKKGSVEPIPRPMQLHEAAMKRMSAEEEAEERAEGRAESAEDRKRRSIEELNKFLDDRAAKK